MSTLHLDTIYNEDCIEGMNKIPDNSIDLVITDPPFAIDFSSKRSNYNRTEKHVLTGYKEISSNKYYDFSIQWMKQVYRVLKNSGSMFVFSGWNNLKDILNALDTLNFITVNHIIWKYQFGVVTKRKFVTSHYHCLYVCKNDGKRKFSPYARFNKNERKTNGGGSFHYEDKEDVWFIKREYWTGDKKTPTKLPAEIIKKILQYTSEENDIVLDPFLGSGQTSFICKEMHRHYIGFEVVKEYYEFAKERLENGKYRIKTDETLISKIVHQSALFDK